jgi:hypothetical protein
MIGSHFKLFQNKWSDNARACLEKIGTCHVPAISGFRLKNVILSVFLTYPKPS